MVDDEPCTPELTGAGDTVPYLTGAGSDVTESAPADCGACSNEEVVSNDSTDEADDEGLPVVQLDTS